MAQGKQAKVLSEPQTKTALRYIFDQSRYPERDQVILLLSAKAGLRAKEIAGLTWSMITDAEGEIGTTIELPNSASKGKGGGRTIPLNKDLRQALVTYRPKAEIKPGGFVLTTERASGFSAGSIAMWFQRLYGALGFDGCSSHSGRRTFITKAAKAVAQVGGSLRDVQQLAGHASLQTTQRYVEGDSEAKRKLVNLI
ncbi:MAG: site-specific integrase [Rhodospirillaceae bacterium]|nr:site-specific integrase [Rhodospirillales bacterium]